jgi:SpoVK/Ycf46/Vps4 family AAA+-type ATPase
VLARSSISGVLLFGPPGNYLIDQGTGKTMLAKAVAQSSGAWFMNVSLSDIFDKYVGEGEKNVKAIFSLARKLNGPCVIFLDEVDALFGTRRSDGSGSNRREVLNEFMSEWDGYMYTNQD